MIGILLGLLATMIGQLLDTVLLSELGVTSPLLTCAVVFFCFTTLRLCIKYINYHAHRPTQCGYISISSPCTFGIAQLADSR